MIIKAANQEGKSHDLIISGKETLEVHRASSYDIFVRTESGGLVRLEKVNNSYILRDKIKELIIYYSQSGAYLSESLTH